MTLQRRIELIAEKIHPFRDRGCLIKTMEDRANQARKIKEIWAKIKEWRFEDQQDYVYDLEDTIKVNICGNGLKH